MLHSPSSPPGNDTNESKSVPIVLAGANARCSANAASAFIFKLGKSVSYYLRLTCGSLEGPQGSDEGREFVVRADDPTVRKQQNNVLTGRNFDSLRLMPGDTIVVPTKPHRGAAPRAFGDWATIFGQLGLVAGGICTLFP